MTKENNPNTASDTHKAKKMMNRRIKNAVYGFAIGTIISLVAGIIAFFITWGFPIFSDSAYWRIVIVAGMSVSIVMSIFRVFA